MKKNPKFLLFILFFMIFSTILNERIFAMEENAFSFAFESIEGQPMPLDQYQGKALLVVNTASLCGFTPQYEGLQNLWEEYKDRGLVVIGVPSNNFGNQEPEGEEKIKDFCETKFGIDFPMTSKEDVKGENAHPFYKWANSQSGKKPKWNFYKYLISPDGSYSGIYSSMTKPKSGKMIKAIEKILP